MRFVNISTLCVAALLLAACSSSNQHSTKIEQQQPRHTHGFKMEIAKIAGKTPEVVAQVLGQPSSEEIIKNKGEVLPKKIYDNGDVEVVYVNGVADWITVYGHGDISYGPEALTQFGLTNLPPTFSNPVATIRWSNLPGFKEVNLFPGQQNKCFYAYFLVKTNP